MKAMEDKKMSEYRVLFGEDGDDLGREVTAAMREGWRPSGGVAIDGGERYTYFYQAMIRETGKEIPAEVAS
jgi:hypothetical protein